MEVSPVRVPDLVFVSILTLFFAARRLPRRAYEALGTPQPTLRARAV
jgi:hypothetical protein